MAGKWDGYFETEQVSSVHGYRPQYLCAELLLQDVDQRQVRRGGSCRYAERVGGRGRLQFVLVGNANILDLLVCDGLLDGL